MSETLTIELAEGKSPDEVRKLFALWLIERGEYSIAAAGRLAGVPLEQWLKWVSSQGIAIIDYEDPNELNAEVEALEALDS